MQPVNPFPKRWRLIVAASLVKEAVTGMLSKKVRKNLLGWSGLPIAKRAGGERTMILNQGRSWLVLAAIGIAAMALSLIPMSTAEAALPSSNKPHSLRGVVSDTVTLYWQPPPTAPSGTHRYRIFRKDLSDGTETMMFSQSSGSADPAETYTDDAVVGGGKYVYRVATFKNSEISPKTSYFKAIVSHNARSDAAKYKAHTLRANVNSNDLVLRWEVISTHRVNGYRILRRDVGGSNMWTTLVDDTSTVQKGQLRKYTDATAQSGQTYRYRVQTRYRATGCSNNGCESFGKATAQATIAAP